MYKLIGDHVQGGTIDATKGKVNVGVKLNLKSYISDDNVKEEKYIKFNEEVTVFRGKNMILKSCSQDGAITSKVAFG